MCSVPARPTEVVDTTGAGDAFLAGFIDAWRKGAAPEACLEAGNQLGAEAVKRVGGPSARLVRRTDMVLIASVTISDRASVGVYEDRSGPAIADWLKNAISSDYRFVSHIIPDGIDSVAERLTALCDEDGADLILTTGGTGPSPRDLTPEALDRIMDKELPGFGELMRAVSLREVPTAILSRQTAGIRGKSLIITLPGKPSAIKTCLDAVFPRRALLPRPDRRRLHRNRRGRHQGFPPEIRLISGNSEPLRRIPVHGCSVLPRRLCRFSHAPS